MAFQIASGVMRIVRQNVNVCAVSYNINQYISTDIDVLKKHTEDVVLSNIKQSDDITKLFGYISTNSHKLNGEHAVQALRVVYDLTRSSSRRITQTDVKNSPIFNQLCRTVKKHSRSLDLNEIIESLKILNFLEVPSNTVIVQTILQLLKEQINDLTLKQIVFLDFLLMKLDESHLTEALQTALPLVFQIRLGFEMDHNDINQLTQLLLYTSRNKVPERSVKSIITGLCISNNDIDVQLARSIVWSLCDLDLSNVDLHNKSIELLKKCLDILKVHIDSLKFKEVFTTLTKLKQKIINQHIEFYDNDFFIACGKYAVRHNMELDLAIIMADVLSRIAAPNINLLMYISRLCAEKPDSLHGFKPRTLMSLVRAYANANFKPSDWDLYKEYVLSHPLMESTDVEKPWTTFMQSLAVLQCYSHTLNEKIFNARFLRELLSKQNSVLNHVQLLTIVAAVKAFNVNYVGPFPPSDIIRSAKQNVSEQPLDATVEPFLEVLLGHPQNYIKGIQMDNGFVVDYMFALEENGVPVSLENEKSQIPGLTNYCDILLPGDCEIVLLQVFHKGCYSINSNRLRGHFDLMLNILRHSGHRVLPISKKAWQALLDPEKVNYLKREVNITLPDSYKLPSRATNY